MQQRDGKVGSLGKSFELKFFPRLPAFSPSSEHWFHLRIAREFLMVGRVDGGWTVPMTGLWKNLDTLS